MHRATGKALIALVVVAWMAGVPSRAHAQQEVPETVGGFPARRFRANEDVAEWMRAYDRCAWATSDLLAAAVTAAERERLGAEWFCYQEDGRWHAVFGRYDPAADRYDAVAHFRQNDGSRYERTTAPPDPARALVLARAVHRGWARVPRAVRESGARFNHFVRRIPAGVEMRALPAWQPNGVILYGMELRYLFDADARRLLDSTVRITALRGARADTTRELTIVNDDDVPTVGEIFFLLMYSRQFRAVTLVSKGSVTRLQEGAEGPYWVHAVGDSARRRRAP